MRGTLARAELATAMKRAPMMATVFRAVPTRGSDDVGEPPLCQQ